MAFGASSRVGGAERYRPAEAASPIGLRVGYARDAAAIDRLGDSRGRSSAAARRVRARD